MNLEKIFNYKVLEYILNKVAALGLLVFIMCTYLLLATGFDLYEFTEYLLNTEFWLYMCGYALLTTVLIDLVRYKWKKLTNNRGILLHCLAGFIVFFPFMGINPFSLIAGFVGALCAFIYAIGSYFFKKKKRFVWMALFVFPLLLGMRLIDFTVKTNWNEEITKSSYSAEFEYFNGKHEIPLSLEKGDKVTSYISFTQTNGGGYGYRILDQNKDYVGMKEIEETYEDYGAVDTKAFQFNAKKAGVYKLIVTGDDLKGKIDVKWEIE
ncbi:hypothetical protein [Oceanobacillus senegalensis]|uniref:hypothetical protein n=1 Tax=Oceanobacillus senegalensis TaxID=1936063 RepID=UPI000A30FF00|nr:hypothetical protein [Oceanobacillus senegalensis]